MNQKELINCAICIVIGFLLYSFIQNGLCGKKDLIEGYYDCDGHDDCNFNGVQLGCCIEEKAGRLWDGCDNPPCGRCTFLSGRC